MTAFDDYPRLLMLHMAANYTNYGFQTTRVDSEDDKAKFRERLKGSLVLRCLLLSSYHSAAPAIDVSLLDDKRGMITDASVGDHVKEGSRFGLAHEQRRTGYLSFYLF